MLGIIQFLEFTMYYWLATYLLHNILMIPLNNVKIEKQSLLVCYIILSLIYNSIELMLWNSLIASADKFQNMYIHTTESEKIGMCRTTYEIQQKLIIKHKSNAIEPLAGCKTTCSNRKL